MSIAGSMPEIWIPGCPDKVLVSCKLIPIEKYKKFQIMLNILYKLAPSDTKQ